jgi:hypothetical protein
MQRHCEERSDEAISAKQVTELAEVLNANICAHSIYRPALRSQELAAIGRSRQRWEVLQSFLALELLWSLQLSANQIIIL